MLVPEELESSVVVSLSLYPGPVTVVVSLLELEYDHEESPSPSSLPESVQLDVSSQVYV